MIDLIAGVKTVTAESGGMLNVNIITSAVGIQLVAAAMLGDREAEMLLRAVVQSAAQIREAPRREPRLCLCCPRRIGRVTPATVFGVAAPAVPNPSQAIGFAFCRVCGERPHELTTKATAALRQIWPDLRAIQVTHPTGGRA